MDFIHTTHYTTYHTTAKNTKKDDNGDDVLLLLGKSGTSKSTLSMDVMSPYFRNGYIVFYKFGDEEIKEVYDLENSLMNWLKKGNKILVAVDSVHHKRTTANSNNRLRSYSNIIKFKIIL